MTQSITLSSTGNAPVTISSLSVVGSLFSASGITLPFTLNPGQTASLTLQFVSPHVSTFTGVLTIASNSSSGSIVVNMSAAGVTGTSTLSVSSTSVNFGNVAVGQTVTQSITLSSTGNAPVTISSLSVVGSLFSASGITLPFTLNPGQTASLTLQFVSPHVSTFTGVLTIASNSSSGNIVVNMSAAGVAGVSSTLSAISCANSAFTGSGTDTCIVTLSSVAPTGGVAVALASNSSAVTLPASVTVAANAVSAGFAAAVSAVTAAQTAVLTGTGGGVSKSLNLQLNAVVPTLTVSSTSVNFGAINVGQVVSQNVTLSSTGTAPVVISSLSIVGSLFTSSGITPPITLNPGQTAALTLHFTSPHVSSFTGILTIGSNSSSGNLVVNMSASGIAALSSISCTSSSMSGSGTDACTASLNGAAPTGGLLVNLSSSDSAVTVPSSLAVAAGATSASFNAAVSTVASSQVATIAGSENGASANFALQLNVGGTLSSNAKSISYGSVVDNDTATQAIVLSASGSSVVVSAASITGATAFTLSSGSFPMTIAAGQTATLNVQFDPTAAGADTGQLTIASTATGAGGSILIGLSGTGLPHEVSLSWEAPSNPSVPVTGFNVYRATGGSSSFQRINSSTLSQTSYMDSTPQGGLSYQYYVTSLDAAGAESVPSNDFTATIP